MLTVGKHQKMATNKARTATEIYFKFKNALRGVVELEELNFKNI